MKKLGALVLSLAMSAALTIPAFAAYTEIKDVTISIDHNIKAGEYDWEFEASTPTNGLVIEDEDVEVTNAPEYGDEWGDDIEPKATIIVRIEDEDEYRFATGIKKDNIKLTGLENEKDARVTSVSRTSKKLTVKVELKELQYPDGYWENLLEVDSAEWNEETGVGYWEENEYADAYEVRVYRGSTGLMKVTKTTDTEYDFSQYFTKKGDYTFRVRALYDDNKGDWEESDDLSVDKEEAEDIYANWDGTTSSGSSNNSSSNNSNNSSNNNASGPQGSDKGAWLRDNVGWWWCNADKTYPSSTWKLIDNKWYYFNQAGYCVQNQWVLTNGLYYYCGPDGDMWVSRWTPDNYWVNADGVWVQ